MQTTTGGALAHSQYVKKIDIPEAGSPNPCPTGKTWNAELKKCEESVEENTRKRKLNLKEKHNRSRQSSAAYLANLKANESPKDKANREWMERNTGPSSYK